MVLSAAGCTRTEAPEPAAPEPVPTVVSFEEAEARRPGDLTQIRASGWLRLLVSPAAVDVTPGSADPARLEVERAELLAERWGVQLQRVVVSAAVDVVAALETGRADLVSPRVLRDAGATGAIAMSAPEGAVDVVWVVAANAPRQPRLASELEGRTAEVCAGSGAPRRLDAALRKSVELREVTEDVHAILARVGSGEAEAAVAWSDDVEAYLGRHDDVRVAVTLREDEPARWGMRPVARQLAEAVDGFIYADALGAHRRARYGGDLDEIKARGVLRVGMLNNAASYFIFRGQEVGFQFELAALFASRLAVRLEVVVPHRPAAMTDLLAQGRVDLVPWSRVEGHLDSSFAYTEPFSHADHVLVQRASEPPITSVEQLRGRTVYARPSSSYVPKLNEIATQVEGLSIAAADEGLETEELIDRVGRGELPLTVSNTVLLGVELTYRDDVQGSLVISRNQPLVYGLRADAPELLAKMNALIRREIAGPAFAELWKKYFDDDKRMGELRAQESAESGRISPYDDLVRRVARRHGLDWRLVLAQMYQESRFDPKATSWAGAIGLLQVMPRTGRELGFVNLEDPESNVRAGVKYLARLIDRTDPGLPTRQRIRFALAAYNAGMGHVQDARRLARRQGLDPNRWFGNVENAMLLLEKPVYYRDAKHGYCRGREPKAYVSRIQSKYDGYVSIMPADGPR